MRPGQVCPGKRDRPSNPKPGLLCFNEARASLPGKAPLAPTSSPLASRASMRPGQVCPGKGGRPSWIPARIDSASMRPGQVCPGKAQVPAVRPWDRTRFNEARASLPGKDELRLMLTSVLRRASMRPGQVCPGKRTTARPPQRRPRGFNEARASLPGKGWWWLTQRRGIDALQ